MVSNNSTAAASPVEPKPLARASALIRMIGWVLRSDAPQPFFDLPSPRASDDFDSFRSRAASELLAMADLADKQAAAYGSFGSLSKDALSGARAFLASYPIVASMLPHLLHKASGEGILAAADPSLLDQWGWGADAHLRLRDSEKKAAALSSARADPAAPLPDRFARSKQGKLADFSYVAQFALTFVGATVWAPIVYPAFCAGYEPRARIQALRRLAKRLRTCSSAVGDLSAPTPSLAFEGLLDARDALGAYQRQHGESSFKAAILSALALERRARAQGQPFGIIRHPDCYWNSDAPSSSGVPARVAVEEELSKHGSDRRLAALLLGSHSSEPIHSDVIGSFAAWLREQNPYAYQDWTSGGYAQCAAMASLDYPVYRALLDIYAPTELLAEHFHSNSAPPDGSGRFAESGLTSLSSNPATAVQEASQRPISTALRWLAKLDELASEQGWPAELLLACRSIVACAGVQLWLCSPDNEEFPVPELDWQIDIDEVDATHSSELFFAASFACAPIALKLGLPASEFAQAIGKALCGRGGVHLNPTTLRLANHDAASAACAGGLAAGEAAMLKELTSGLPSHNAPPSKLRL